MNHRIDLTMNEIPTALQATVRIEHCYRSREHNFKGHHGGPAGTHPTEETAYLDCVAGRGIVGDRYFDYRPDYKGQITFLDEAAFEALREAVGAPDVAPSALRRNVVTHGIDLNRLIGRTFDLQGIRFEGTEACSPCYWMDQAVGPGAESFLEGRGGLRARILSDGRLQRGEAQLLVHQ